VGGGRWEVGGGWWVVGRGCVRKMRDCERSGLVTASKKAGQAVHTFPAPALGRGVLHSLAPPVPALQPRARHHG